MNTQNSQKTGTAVIALIILSVLLLLFNIFQLTQSDYLSVKKKDFKQINEQLQVAVNAAKMEVNKYKGISIKLDMVIKEANAKIVEQELRINKILSSNSSLKQENKVYAVQIKEITEEYLQTIDSLLLEEGLNMALENTIENLEDEINQLNAKLGVASMFVTDNVTITALNEKQSGTFKETALAKKVKAIRVCYDVVENPITKKGLYEVYLRVLSPDQGVLYHSEEEGLLIKHPLLDINVNYSYSETMNYKNEKISNCITWQVPETLNPGVYVVELFTDSNMLSTSTFTIK